MNGNIISQNLASLNSYQFENISNIGTLASTLSQKTRSLPLSLVCPFGDFQSKTVLLAHGYLEAACR